jgi:GNAT superfamily N-acetyltransferase
MLRGAVGGPVGNVAGDENGPPPEVAPATPDRWADIDEFFARCPCRCQYWRLSSSEFSRASRSALSDSLRAQLDHPTPPGVLAYLDGQMVGWCGIGPRHEMERLVRSRTIPAIDDRPVWSITCFLVRVGYRRRGVARALLHGAIRTAREHGVETLEAYPVDPAGKRIDVAFAYAGTASMFEKAGFQRVLETAARSAGLPRWLMRLHLRKEGAGEERSGGRQR